MSEPVPLRRADLAAEPALDWRALFADGLAQLRALCGARWTDHHLHDPGITTLELASHALADLAYRSGLPLADWLASSAPQGNAAATFWQAQDVLPQSPWTLRDLRKCLVDIDGIRNAWLHEVPGPVLWLNPRTGLLAREPSGEPGERPVSLQGRWQPLLEYDERLNAEQHAERQAEAVATLQARRPLCLDFLPPQTVPVQRFALCAEVALTDGADARRTAARLLHTAHRTLAPLLRPLTLDEALARPGPDGQPRRVDEVFEGPWLTHGFLDDGELDASELPAVLRLSDLINALMDVPGVEGLRDIRLQPLGEDGFALPTDDPWRLPVRPGHAPRLAWDSGRLVLSQRGLVVAGWNVAEMPDGVRDALQDLLDADHAVTDTPRLPQLPQPAGRVRPLGAHRPLQDDFPELYGLARPDQDPRVRQFQGYLLFIDQWMANQLAQATQLAQLYSVAPTRMQALTEAWMEGVTPPTLLARRLSELPGHEALYRDTPEQPLDDAGLTRLLEPDPRPRQAALLDHLLARAGEDMGAQVEALQQAFGSGGGLDALIERARFLAELPRLGAERGLAYQQHRREPEMLWNSDNISGLERRLARLLGIANPQRRSLSVVAHDTYAEVDATPGDEFRFRVRDAVSGKILLSSSTHYVSPEAAQAEMMAAVERAQGADGYQRRQTLDGRHYFNIVDAGGEVIARRIEYFAQPEAMEQAISHLQRYLREHYSGEGLYLIELPLLRPEQPDDPLLQPCLDEGCGDCDGDDPYSWRLLIVLPSYAGRFAHPAFRAHAEQQIRREVPAHLLPRICWAGPLAMAEFEGAYRDWLALHAGAAAPPRAQVLTRFLRAVTEVRNTHPAQRLTDCVAELPRPAFVLGRSALGTEPSPPPPPPPLA